MLWLVIWRVCIMMLMHIRRLLVRIPLIVMVSTPICLCGRVLSLIGYPRICWRTGRYRGYRRRRRCRCAGANIISIVPIVLMNLSLDVIHELPAVLGLSKGLQIIMGVWLVPIGSVVSRCHWGGRWWRVVRRGRRGRYPIIVARAGLGIASHGNPWTILNLRVWLMMVWNVWLWTWSTFCPYSIIVIIIVIIIVRQFSSHF